MESIRNFCIIAHIDHGKSTLADRFLELTNTVDKTKMHAQMLDSMDLERERGITIKLQPVHMHTTVDGEEYALNLIDTPGHVDFGYEVSRSLMAVEGAILLVDATQGIQAQTLANLAVAQQHNLAVVPVINKIDLPNAEPEKVTLELAELLHCDPDIITAISAKTGENCHKVVEQIVRQVPAPQTEEAKPLKALIFDSQFNTYRGVVIQIRVMEGSVKAGDQVKLMGSGQTFTVEEVGHTVLGLQKSNTLQSGEIGYIVTGLKQVTECRVGDTVTHTSNPTPNPIPGYTIPQPMVYASLYSASADAIGLREALEKLTLNDSAVQYEPHYSEAFGSGFRCGFLGLLHLEIVKERLEREFEQELIISTPTVAFKGDQNVGYEEPWVEAEVVTPAEYIGPIMDLFETNRGVYQSLNYFGIDSNVTSRQNNAILVYEIPLTDIIVDFNDRIKSLSAGYASLSYKLIGYRPGKLVPMDILIGGEKVPPLSQVVPEEKLNERAQAITSRLKELIPKQMFEVSIQAAVGGRIISRETVSAFRKDVTAKLYGGDVTRKRKLLEKQKKGKKRMKQWGRVDIPSDVFLEVLKPKLS